MHITKHALARFKQRFRLYFHKSYFYNDELTLNLIHSLIDGSTEYDYSKSSPFYRNKVESIYGPTSVRVVDKPTEIYFLINPDTSMLKTVVSSFDVTKIKHKHNVT